MYPAPAVKAKATFGQTQIEMRGSDEGTKVLLLGSHRRRPNRTRSIKQKDRPKVVENLSEFKRAETKFPSDDVRRRRRRSERKRRVWKLLPDGKIFRGDSEPSESQHVSARFSHSSGLCPCDLIDGQSFPPSPLAPTLPRVLRRAKINSYLHAKKVAGRGIPHWPESPYQVREFCMSYVPGAPIASPGDSHGSGEPFPGRERQPRHRKSENPDNSGS